MTRDEAAPSPVLFDRRIVERNIKRGLTTRKDYNMYLKSLADVAGNIKSPDEGQRSEESSEADAGSSAPTPPTGLG
jgi:hypothetical protein